MNTADSRVALIWDAVNSAALSLHQRDRLSGRLVDGGLMIVASEHRAQLRHRDTARERLVALVGEALRPSAHIAPTDHAEPQAERAPTAGKQRRTVIKSLRKRQRGD